MIKILSFCTNPDILPVMDRLVSNHADDWESLQAADLATAQRLVSEQNIDVVLLGAGTGQPERSVLETQTSASGKPTRYVNHYGGGSGLLYAEVEEALKG